METTVEESCTTCVVTFSLQLMKPISTVLPATAPCLDICWLRETLYVSEPKVPQVLVRYLQ